MLNASNAVATVAVTDLARARAFYGDVLGLSPVPYEDPEMRDYVQTYKSGSSELLVYVSQFAGTNQVTAVTWTVDDVEAVVARLKTKGVTFERYDMPGFTMKGDVHVTGTWKNAWCKDPDGNILAIVGA